MLKDYLHESYTFKFEIPQIDTDKKKFPTYTKDIINKANIYSQATSSKNMGSVSDMAKEFKGLTLEDWINFYNGKHPNKIKKARVKIKTYIRKMKKAYSQINDNLINDWLEDLIYKKTFIGLKIEKLIMTELSMKFNVKYTPTNQKGESKGIDGYLNGNPVSIKPASYQHTLSKQLEKIEYPIIFYTVSKGNITIESDDNLETYIKTGDFHTSERSENPQRAAAM